MRNSARDSGSGEYGEHLPREHKKSSRIRKRCIDARTSRAPRTDCGRKESADLLNNQSDDERGKKAERHSAERIDDIPFEVLVHRTPRGKIIM